MTRAITTVVPEATIIGFLSLVSYYILKKLGATNYVSAFLVGFLLHLIFEYSPVGNINELWCRSVFK